ncbi:MAG: membrane protease YdiL (CAAX protease family) [Bradymonadia bacterium]|jgi:membrane protease YdiL (CAAX protease family)
MDQVNELFFPVPVSFEFSAAALLMLAATVIFAVQSYALQADRFERRLLARGVSADKAQASGILTQRVLGAILFGLGGLGVWLALFWQWPAWASFGRAGSTVAWALGITAVALPFVLISGRKPAMHEQYPEIRTREWTPSLAKRSLAAWALYLLGYEVFFRGLITLGAVSLFGLWPGLSVATALYVLAHLRKGASETFACIPMGFVFGMAAVQTGSIIAPWLAHIVFACVSEIVTARTNPAVRYPS